MQKMQKKMAEAQEELATQRFEAVAGGGMVKVVVSGQKEVLEVELRSSCCRSRRYRNASRFNRNCNK